MVFPIRCAKVRRTPIRRLLMLLGLVAKNHEGMKEREEQALNELHFLMVQKKCIVNEIISLYTQPQSSSSVRQGMPCFQAKLHYTN